MSDRAQQPRRGRGALGNPAGRFERTVRTPVDDGWPGDDEDPPPLETVVREEVCRSAISRNQSPDVPFERSINPYRGCEHGCVYCFARPTHAFLGLSPGLDFETRLFAKVNVAERLAEELRRPGYGVRTIMLGANTDCYQPIERSHRLTRRILEILAACRHPVAIATKSALVLRDRDLLKAMTSQNLVSVGISLTTLDRGLARVMEPRASSPGRRLATIEALAGDGVPVAVLAAPMIPFINDHELEAILAAATRAGACGAAYTVLRLPHELKDVFIDWLEAHRPERAGRVLNSLRHCRDGNLYVADWGTRMTGTGAYADLLARRFALACRRLGLATGGPATRPLDGSRFRPPAGPSGQLSLF